MSSARFAFRKALIDAVTAVDAATQFEHGYAGELQQKESRFLSETTGPLNVPVFTGQPSEDEPLHYDDVFKFTVTNLAQAPGQTSEQAAERGDALAAPVRKVLREHPPVEDPDGRWSITHALMTEERDVTYHLGTEGARCIVEIDVQVSARISGPAE